jgi:hypothetical protein
VIQRQLAFDNAILGFDLLGHVDVTGPTGIDALDDLRLSIRRKLV